MQACQWLISKCVKCLCQKVSKISREYIIKESYAEELLIEYAKSKDGDLLLPKIMVDLP